MHSSRMRTDRRLTVSWREGGLPRPCRHPKCRPHPSKGRPPHSKGRPPPFKCRQTDACENITFPASLCYAVGKNTWSETVLPLHYCSAVKWQVYNVFLILREAHDCVPMHAYLTDLPVLIRWTVIAQHFSERLAILYQPLLPLSNVKEINL